MIDEAEFDKQEQIRQDAEEEARAEAEADAQGQAESEDDRDEAEGLDPLDDDYEDETE